MLVEKDKQTLLQAFESIGQTALDHSKDKFLVQTCEVSSDFENEYAAACESDAAMGYDKLSAMWTTMPSNKNIVVSNKKLSVRHVALKPGQALTAAPKIAKAPSKPVESMDQEELLLEVKSLRQKNDELVAFSVAATAERDSISNVLELTKRQLSQEAMKSATQRNASNTAGARVGNDTQEAAGSNTFLLALVALFMFIVGVRLEAAGYVDALKQVPGLNLLLGDVAADGMDEL